MDLKDQFKYLVGGYYGIETMDNYELKVYILNDIENYIREYIDANPIKDYDYQLEATKIKQELNLKTMLQDSLLVLPKVNAPMELILLVKEKIKEISKKSLRK